MIVEQSCGYPHRLGVIGPGESGLALYAPDGSSVPLILTPEDAWGSSSLEPGALAIADDRIAYESLEGFRVVSLPDGAVLNTFDAGPEVWLPRGASFVAFGSVTGEHAYAKPVVVGDLDTGALTELDAKTVLKPTWVSAQGVIAGVSSGDGFIQESQAVFFEASTWLPRTPPFPEPALSGFIPDGRIAARSGGMPVLWDPASDAVVELDGAGSFGTLLENGALMTDRAVSDDTYYVPYDGRAASLRGDLEPELRVLPDAGLMWSAVESGSNIRGLYYRRHDGEPVLVAEDFPPTSGEAVFVGWGPAEPPYDLNAPARFAAFWGAQGDVAFPRTGQAPGLYRARLPTGG